VIWEHLKPKAGELVVVTGAAGMAGHIMVQLLKLLNVRVIALCRSASKAETLKEYCERVVIYTDENLAEVLDTCYAQGPDAVIDSVGGKNFAILIERLAPMGRAIILGASGERKDDKNEAQRVNRFILEKGCTITGFCLHHHRDKMQRHLGELLLLYQGGTLHVHLDNGTSALWSQRSPMSKDPREAPQLTMPGLESVHAGLQHILAGNTAGKVVVRVSDTPQPHIHILVLGNPDGQIARGLNRCAQRTHPSGRAYKLHFPECPFNEDGSYIDTTQDGEPYDPDGHMQVKTIIEYVNQAIIHVPASYMYLHHTCTIIEYVNQATDSDPNKWTHTAYRIREPSLEGPTLPLTLTLILI